MKVEDYPYGVWGPRCYLVRDRTDLQEVCAWMLANHIDHWLVSSGYGGYVFQIRSDDEVLLALFKLRWL